LRHMRLFFHQQRAFDATAVASLRLAPKRCNAADIVDPRFHWEPL